MVAKGISDNLLTKYLGETGCPTKIIVNLVRNNGNGHKVLTENLLSPKCEK